MPESKHLRLGDSYKEALINIFKSSIALDRETVIGGVEIGIEGGVVVREIEEIEIYPELTVEPLSSLYYRRASAYSFIKKLLISTFGRDELKKIYRLTAQGRIAEPLMKELEEMEILFYGAYLISAKEIGMDIQNQLEYISGDEVEECKLYAHNWLESALDDQDIGKDNRMMVPLFFDIERQKTKVWVTLGYIREPLKITFFRNPRATIKDKEGNAATAFLHFKEIWKELIIPLSTEIYVKDLLNRDEFRTLCDKYKTPDAILEALRNQ